MATIPLKRGFALGTRGVSGAPVVQVPLNSGQTGYPGYIVTFSSGKGNLAKAGSSGLLGLLESAHSNSTDGEIATVSLFVPGTFWEFSADGTVAASKRGTKMDFKDPSAGGVTYEFAALDPSGGNGMIVAFFASDQGVFETNRFIAGNATSETAGASNTPQSDMGVPGDENPRLVCVPDTSAIVLGD